MPDEAEAAQRLDKWLWFARFARTRPLAASLITAGHVRVNGVKAQTAARAVRPGDILTVSHARETRVLRILGCASRREPYETARALYEEVSPPSLARAGQSG